MMLAYLGEALFVMALLRSRGSDRVSSREVMSPPQVEAICAALPDTAIPFPLDAPWYQIVGLSRRACR